MSEHASMPGQPGPGASPGKGATQHRGRLERITDWENIVILACYSSSALAQVCGVSLRHLQRHVRATHNQNLGEWLNNLRLEHAYQKLSKGLTVKETAYSLGFKQVSHFSRLFKKKFGTSPSTVPITVGEPPPATPPMTL